MFVSTFGLIYLAFDKYKILSKKSLIWNYFDTNVCNISKAKCIFCFKILSRSGIKKHKMPTTILINQLTNIHKKIFKISTLEFHSNEMNFSFREIQWNAQNLITQKPKRYCH